MNLKSRNLFERFFAIKLSNENIQLNNILNLIDYIAYEKYLPKKRPFISKIPYFHPQITPSKIRNAVFKSIINRNINKMNFPNFPFDFTVDILRNYIKEKYFSKKKTMSFWPRKKKFVIILTHDVDSNYIFKNKSILNKFLEIEKKFGFKSGWYIVSNKFILDHNLLEKLQENGNEIGFHGDNHDYRLPFLKEAKIRKRLNKCKSFLSKYNVTGGRSPLFLRTPLFLSVLQDYLQYDTSFHDTTISVLAGRREGCCSCFPFFINNLLEIPTTIPEDHLLLTKGFSVNEIIKIQCEKIDKIKRMGGIVNILTHPEPHISANKKGFKIYYELLKKCYNEKDDALILLPNELNKHWRERDKKILKLIK